METEITIARRYFGGNAFNLGIVNKITPSTFKEFIDQTLGLPIALNVTRGQYWEMDKSSRQKAKRVPFVTPALWRERPDGMLNGITRKVENMTGVALLCIDMDEPRTAAPYYSDPGVLEDQLSPYGFALYKTASSTPDSPRLRLMVDAYGLPVEKYGDAVEDIARRIGLPLSALTRESKQPFMPMFLPTVFADEKDSAVDHPLLFVCHFKRRPYTTKDLESSEYSLLGDEEEVRTFKKKELPAGMDGSDPLETLDYLRAPLPGCTVADIRDALDYINPDVGYAEWVSIAASLKHQFPHDPQKGEAYKVFDVWSAKGSKYAGAEDTLAKWGSFSQTPKGRLPLTIRSVMHAATANGWSPVQVTDQCVSEVTKWLGAPSEVPQSKFLAVATAKVAAIPMLSFAEEEGLLRQLMGVANKRFKVKVSVGALRKDLKRARTLEREKTTESRKKSGRLPQWAMNMCYVEARDVFMRTNSKLVYAPTAVDKTYSRELLDYTDKPGEEAKSKSRPDVAPTNFLLNVLQIPTAYDTIYDPTETGSENIVERDGVRYVNVYTANYPEGNEQQAQYAEEVLRRHLGVMVREEEYREVILDYLAYLVQNPGGKVRWAVLLQGAQGCGKTFFFEVMEAVLGTGNATTVGPEALNSQWTEWAYGSQLVALEEIRAAGHNRHDLMNKLKSYLTNVKVSITQKYRDARVVKNYTNYLLFTNHHDAVVLTDDDRRYFVVKARQQCRQDVEDMGGSEYFDPLFNMLRTHAAGLRHFLLNHKIRKSFDPNGTAPRTKYADELVRDSRTPATQLVMDALEDHDRGDGIRMVTPEVISSRAFSDLMDVRGVLANGSQAAHAMREAGYHYAGRPRLSDGHRHGLWLRYGATNGKPPVDTAIELAEMAMRGESTTVEELDIL